LKIAGHIHKETLSRNIINKKKKIKKKIINWLKNKHSTKEKTLKLSGAFRPLVKKWVWQGLLYKNIRWR
jgi:hypothetical protein